MATVNCVVLEGFNLAITEERHEIGETIALNQTDYDYLIERLAVAPA